MEFSRHVNITGGALRDWFIAQCYDSIAVGLLWWIGLVYLRVPLAPLDVEDASKPARKARGEIALGARVSEGM